MFFGLGMLPKNTKILLLVRFWDPPTISMCIRFSNFNFWFQVSVFNFLVRLAVFDFGYRFLTFAFKFRFLTLALRGWKEDIFKIWKHLFMNRLYDQKHFYDHTVQIYVHRSRHKQSWHWRSSLKDADFIENILIDTIHLKILLSFESKSISGCFEYSQSTIRFAKNL